MGLVTTARRVLVVFLLAASASVSGVYGHCQGITTGSISGIVADPQGAVLPQSAVTAVEEASRASFTTTSGPDGSFAVHNLPVGSFTVTLNSVGFTALNVIGVRVTAGVTTQLGIQRLSIGTSASITVEGATSILETGQAQVTTSFEGRAIQDLPLNTNFDNLALLAPGVVQTHDAQFSNSNGVGISANGQRGRSNNFEIDGQNNNDNNVGGPQIFFGNADALSDIQIITNNFGAQYGRNMGAVVNYVTKSGTNAFHGSGFEDYTGSWLSSLQNGQKTPLNGFCASGQDPASGCTPVTVPRTVDNKYGATLGGPVLKNKLWLFGSTYWDHTREGGSISTSQGSLTPTPQGLSQLQAAFSGNPAVASLVNNGPFGIKVGSPSVVSGSTLVQPVTDGNTLASVEFGQVARNVPALFNDQEDMGRADWQPSPKDHFFVRYFYQSNLVTGNLAGNPQITIAAGGYTDIISGSHSVGADWTHVFSPAWVNQLRYGFQQVKTYFQGGGQPACTTTNFTACGGDITFQDGSDFAYGYSSANPQAKITKVTQVQDNANWTRRKHSIALGGEVDYQNSPGVYLPNYNGLLTYQDFNSFLQGENGVLNLTDGNPVVPLTEPDVALYFQDDWKVMADFTLNLGLRWEFFGQAVNQLHDSTVKRETGPNPFWDVHLPLSVRTFQKEPNNWKNYQPRIGFAWNPRRGRLVVRGGYAINFDPAFYNIFNNSAIEAPVANSGAILCGGGYQCLPAGGTSGAQIRAQNLAALPRHGDPRFDVESPLPPHFYSPYTQSYTLGLEYGLNNAVVVAVRYVGNHASRLFQAINANPILEPLAASLPTYAAVTLCQDPNAPGFLTQACDKGAIQAATTNTAFSIYNSLQTNITTRAYRGLTGTVQYTYSRTIDNSSEILPTGAGGNTLEFAQNPLNTNDAERGVSGISYTNVAAFGFVYDLPSVRQAGGWLGKAANGYSLNLIYGFNTGQPFTPYQGVPANGSYCDANFNLFVLGVDSCRPVLLNKRAPNDPASYAINDIPTADSLGNPFPGVGRNSLRGQTFNNLDASIFKTTALGERIKLQLQLNAFNVLNRQFLGVPGAFIGAPNFLTGVFNQGTNRSVQLGGKLIF